LPVFLDTADGIFPGSVDIGVVIKETAAPAGFDITVRNNPSDSYWSDVWMKRDLCAVYWGTRATPGLMFALAYECGAAWNDTYWCNDEFSRLLVEAKTAVDFETKKKIYWRLQEIVHNEGGVAAFMFPAVIDAYSDKIGGVRPDATRALMGCRLAERAWMTS
jgi:peptide/nickel transport system substrate-binding protein